MDEVVWRPPSPTCSKLSQQGSSVLYVRRREAGCRARGIEIAGRVIELRKWYIRGYKAAPTAEVDVFHTSEDSNLSRVTASVGGAAGV